MDVGLGLLGRLQLDDEVDIGDVEASGSDVGGDKHAELALLEALHRHFSLVLGDVTVHHLDVLLDLVRQKKGVGVGLSLGEDDDLATLSVDDEDVCEGREPVLVGALDGQVRHIACRLVLQVLRKVHNSHTLLHVGRGDISHPPWNGGGEEQDLQVFTTLVFAGGQDLFKGWLVSRC